MTSAQLGDSARPREVPRDVYNYRGRPSSGPSLPVNAAELTHRLQLYQIQEAAKKARRKKIADLNRSLRKHAPRNSRNLTAAAASGEAADLGERKTPEEAQSTTATKPEEVTESAGQPRVSAEIVQSMAAAEIVQPMAAAEIVQPKVSTESVQSRESVEMVQAKPSPSKPRPGSLEKASNHRRRESGRRRRSSSSKSISADDPDISPALEFIRSSFSSECIDEDSSEDSKAVPDKPVSGEGHAEEVVKTNSEVLLSEKSENSTKDPPERPSPTKARRPGMSSRRSSSSSIRRPVRKTSAVYVPRNARKSHMVTTASNAINDVYSPSSRARTACASGTVKPAPARQDPRAALCSGNSRALNQPEVHRHAPGERWSGDSRNLHQPRGVISHTLREVEEAPEQANKPDEHGGEETDEVHEILERTANDRPNWTQQDEREKSRPLSSIAVNLTRQLRRISMVDSTAAVQVASKKSSSPSVSLTPATTSTPPALEDNKAGQGSKDVPADPFENPATVEHGQKPTKIPSQAEVPHEASPRNAVEHSRAARSPSDKVRSGTPEVGRRKSRSQRKTVEIMNATALSMIEERERLLRHKSLNFDTISKSTSKPGKERKSTSKPGKEQEPTPTLGKEREARESRRRDREKANRSTRLREVQSGGAKVVNQVMHLEFVAEPDHGADESKVRDNDCQPSAVTADPPNERETAGSPQAAVKSLKVTATAVEIELSSEETPSPASETAARQVNIEAVICSSCEIESDLLAVDANKDESGTKTSFPGSASDNMESTTDERNREVGADSHIEPNNRLGGVQPEKDDNKCQDMSVSAQPVEEIEPTLERQAGAQKSEDAVASTRKSAASVPPSPMLEPSKDGDSPETLSGWGQEQTPFSKPVEECLKREKEVSSAPERCELHEQAPAAPSLDREDSVDKKSITQKKGCLGMGCWLF